MKKHGHYCKVCGEYKANEKFSGKGHASHICKSCASLPAETICDLLRSRSRIEIQTFQGALKAYARRKDKNLRALMQYAGMFKVEKILRQYLEVLL